jgi:hypothetical protein
MPSLGEAPSGGAKTFWLLLGRLPKVTRCKSGTISGRYRSNGYVHLQARLRSHCINPFLTGTTGASCVKL